MPMLLSTGEIDGYIAWQPIVAIAPVSGIGKVVSYSQDLPPEGMWNDHPCCVIVARDDFISEHADVVNAISALGILGNQYVNEHQNESAGIVADWLVGKGNFTYGNVSVSSVDVLDQAIPTVKFTSDPSEQWQDGVKLFVDAQSDLGYLTGSLKNATSDEQTNLLFDTQPHTAAEAMIANGTIITPEPLDEPLGIGYLMSDHHASLFVAIKNWEYFNETYGIALKPKDPTQTRPENLELIINGKKIADVNLVSGSAGPALMQLAATDNIQVAWVGAPPAISAIDKGTPIKILQPVNTEGSGLVVAASAPASDWPTFVEWAKTRAAEGNPLKIAAPLKGSIQDVMLKFALKDSGLVVKEV
jgi:NitT/TauT family transport system substrate-binding protein